MKLLVVCAFVAVVAAAPQNQNLKLLKIYSDNGGFATYNFAYVESDGSKRQEQGELGNAGAEGLYVAMPGSYSRVGPDGVTYIYTADEINQVPDNVLPPEVVATLLG